jgi:hypothetical protein
MKLVVYTLNADGTIPDYVTDGGYMYSSNGNAFPQSFDLVGVATDEAGQTGFASESALLAYATDKGLEYKTHITNEIIPIENVVASIWSKMVGV